MFVWVDYSDKTLKCAGRVITKTKSFNGVFWDAFKVHLSISISTFNPMVHGSINSTKLNDLAATAVVMIYVVKFKLFEMIRLFFTCTHDFTLFSTNFSGSWMFDL